jgi:hypothetical protein
MNNKPFRLHQAGAGSPSLNPVFAPDSDSGAIATDGNNLGISGWFGSYPDNGIGPGNDVPFSAWGSWLHVQYLLDTATPGVANGSFFCYLNSVLRFNRPGNVQLLPAGYINWPELYLGNYSRGDDPYHDGAHAYWESVYLDSSWARVELGNNATYGGCTHREIQIPSAWSNTQIQFKVNRGSSAANAPCWIHVVNSNNTPVISYPVTLGQTY